jgi:hypothetical protein
VSKIPDWDDDFPEDWPPCPHCNGTGEVTCHCGGDLCICENYGDAPCPVCQGTGSVSGTVYENYLKRQAEAHAVLAPILKAAQEGK